MTTSPIEPDRTAALVERLFNATIHTLELYAAHLGVRLGLYTALADGGAVLVADELFRFHLLRG